MNRLIATLVFVVLPLAMSVAASAQKLNPEFEGLIDDYLAEFHGVGNGPSATNNGSANYYRNRLQTTRALLDELGAIDRQTLTFQQDIDYRFLEGILEDSIVDQEELRYWEKDPTLYLRIEPIVSPRGGLLYLEDRPVEERATAVLRIMKTIPTRLQNARIVRIRGHYVRTETVGAS